MIHGVWISEALDHFGQVLLLTPLGWFPVAFFQVGLLHGQNVSILDKFAMRISILGINGEISLN